MPFAVQIDKDRLRPSVPLMHPFIENSNGFVAALPVRSSKSSRRFTPESALNKRLCPLLEHTASRAIGPVAPNSEFEQVLVRRVDP
jgi:hypothetical protein